MDCRHENKINVFGADECRDCGEQLSENTIIHRKLTMEETMEAIGQD